jgi:hypothetical protein
MIEENDAPAKKQTQSEDKENLLQPKTNIPIFNKIGLKDE